MQDPTCQVLSVFNFDDAAVRTLMLDGEPWFVGKDIASVLGYSRERDAIDQHCKGAVKHRLPSNSGEQEYLIIPERDVYRLIMRSKLPAAERFEEWVVGEVLPTIRKTGAYLIEPAEVSIARGLIAATALLEDRKRLIEAQQQQIEHLQPKADFYDAVTESGDAVDIGTVAKVLNLGIGRTRLFEFLRDDGILMHNNRPYQRHIDDGHFRVIETTFDKPDGTTHIYFKTVAFQKGVDYIRKRYLSRKERAA